MGVSWSKETDDLESLAPGSVLNKDTLVHIFGYVDSLEEISRIALVSRWWSALLAKNVVPGLVHRASLRAWYHADGLKCFRPSQSPMGTEACSAWHPSPRGAQLFLDAFAFPTTLRSRVADETELAALGQWSAAASKGSEPKVIVNKAGKKSLVFVDVPERNAVHLRTALFPAPLAQPVTVFIVGIAFEDSTFVSGINSRFEVCHAYPTANQSEHDRTPVSITAKPSGNSSDSDDEPNASIVCGVTQPGDWHVYCAVFNGEHSEVFVDGRREGPEVEADVGQGFLDGFTIGADHRNDFPLGCTAEGKMPGAISEVVVFGSVLPAKDRSAVERKLMKEHGLALPSEARDAERQRHRQASAMVSERAPGRLWPSIPLRYLARHKEVSWTHEHPVTGEPVRPKRIGVKECAESSSWDDA